MVKNFDILDILFNSSSEAFIIKNNCVSLGMKILDIGCGTGVMSCWLAKQVGPEGLIVAIDNNQNQLTASKVKAKVQKLKNLEFHLKSAYELESLNQYFDMVYCRFILNHLQYPMKVMENIFKILKQSGSFIVEEGIESSAFTYPYADCWGTKRWNNRIPIEDLEGQSRDNNLGMKLLQKMTNVGFNIKDAALVQPLLFTEEQKELVLSAMVKNKQSLLGSENYSIDWQSRVKDFKKVVENQTQCVAFYQSCQVLGTKPNLGKPAETPHILFKLLKISDVTKIFQNNIHMSITEIEVLLINATQNYQKHSTGVYAMELKGSDSLIGLAGFDFPLVEDYIQPEMFIKLCGSYNQNEDFLVEITTALRDYAFSQLSITHFIATLSHNDALLIKVLEKIGMQYQKSLIWHGQKMLLYSITRI